MPSSDAITRSLDGAGISSSALLSASAPRVSPAEDHTLYYHYSRYLRETFGGKTYKVVVNSGLTCPTRDGTITKGGCTFCDVRGSSSFFGKQGRGGEITAQIDSRLPGTRARFGSQKHIAYFQSYTNTYSDADYLREIYTEALSHPDISGLAIGTRPDCLPDSVIELLEELAGKHYVSLELGVQSFENPTLEWFIRGHDGESSRVALRKMRERAPHVHTCAHFIFGAPTDSPTAPRDAALEINHSGVRGVKLHQMMVLEHTKLAEMYRTEPFPILTVDEYAERAIEFLEHLDPAIYVERLQAKASHSKELIAPAWSVTHWQPYNRILAMMQERGSYQGKALGHAQSS
jgi:radical SAM protein (TIGR01212 family)